MGLFAQTVVDAIDTPEVEWKMMAPLLVLAVGAIVLITITSVVPRTRRGGFPAAFTITTAAVAGWFLKVVWSGLGDHAETYGIWRRQWIVADALMIDGFTIFVWGVILLSVFLCGGLLDSYLRREGFDGPEWYTLMMISAVGGMLLAAAHDLILIFLAVEILSIAVYVLAGLHLRRSDSQEAAFKYFILGALASAFLLYGIALVYGATGTTHLVDIFMYRSTNAAGLSPLTNSSMMLAGMAMIMIGFAFKISAVPFHVWTPDVYQGAPTPITAFMASAVKAAAFAGLFRIMWEGFTYYVDDWRPVLSALAIASLVVGSFLALAQTNVKRMLAYSSIVHAGFILIAVYAVPGVTGIGGDDPSRLGIEAFLFYLLAYTLMTIGTFGVLTAAGGVDDANHELADYRGLSKSQPVLAGLMAVLLFAQAGIPFTAGFVAKFRVIAAAAANEAYILGAVAMLAAVVSAVLYLRIVVTMFLVGDELVAHAVTDTDDDAATDGVADETASNDHLGEASTPFGQVYTPKPLLLAVMLAAFGTIVLGVFPQLVEPILTDAADSLSTLRQR